VELAVQSIARQLPAPALCCGHDPDHLATLYCDACGLRVCGDCGRAAHSGHEVHPCRYVDWGGRPPHGTGAELGELIGDAAQALQAGLADLLPKLTPGLHEVALSDEPPSADDEGPVRKLRRWLASL
jgi:hypothetical protein